MSERYATAIAGMLRRFVDGHSAADHVLTLDAQAQAFEALVESGVDYCRTHNGVRNEDERYCDFRDVTDPEQACHSCGGSGIVRIENVSGFCPDCDEGTTLCDLTPLLYAATNNGSRAGRDSSGDHGMSTPHPPNEPSD